MTWKQSPGDQRSQPIPGWGNMRAAICSGGFRLTLSRCTASGPSMWRVVDSQRGGTVFNLPEEDLENNREPGVFSSLLLPSHFLRNRRWFWFSFWKSKETLWTWCPCWFKNDSPTFRIHQLSRCRSLQIFIMIALSLCYYDKKRRRTV